MNYKYIALIFIILLFLLTYMGYINYIDNNKSVEVFSNSVSLSRSNNNQLIKLMTYNIRHGVGTDDRLSINRTAEIIKNSEADIIGLNEVDNRMFRSEFQKQFKILARELQMNYVFGSTLKSIIGSYGNAIITRFPIEKVNNYSLPVKIGREPRGLLEAQIILPDQTVLRVLTTHLSLANDERRQQITWLNRYLTRIKNEPFVLMGDFNGRVSFSDNLNLHFRTGITYPADSPDRSIDMFFSNCNLGQKTYTMDVKGSDHLPLMVNMRYNIVNKG